MIQRTSLTVWPWLEQHSPGVAWNLRTVWSVSDTQNIKPVCWTRTRSCLECPTLQTQRRKRHPDLHPVCKWPLTQGKLNLSPRLMCSKQPTFWVGGNQPVKICLRFSWGPRTKNNARCSTNYMLLPVLFLAPTRLLYMYMYSTVATSGFLPKIFVS